LLRTVRLSVRTALLALLAAVVGLLVIPGNAFALTVSRAQLSGGQLQVEGANAAPGIFVTVSSASSSAGARSDQSGAYRVSASNFHSDDCKAVVTDRQTFTATVNLAGCTPTSATPPSPTSPTGSCAITQAAPATFHAGDSSVLFAETTGCDISTGPVQWKLLGGHVPTGMQGPNMQGQRAAGFIGTPTVEGTYSFTLQATDSLGQTDSETFTATVTAPRAVAVSTTSVQPVTAGQSYQVRLAADGGVPGYAWTLRSGSLPSGVSLTSGGALAGTPKTRGSFPFTVRATDSRGAFADQAFPLTVN
jgi:hypothetical protein